MSLTTVRSPKRLIKPKLRLEKVPLQLIKTSLKGAGWSERILLHFARIRHRLNMELEWFGVFELWVVTR